MTRFEKFLVPVDFSDHSREALDVAIGLAEAFGGEIHLLHCYPINPVGISPYGIVIPEGFDRELRDAAGRQLAEWSKRVEAKGVACHQTLSSMFPSEVIAKTAEEIGAELIVMGTRGLSGIKHVMLGSVAERTIRIAPCPVLTVKSRAK